MGTLVFGGENLPEGTHTWYLDATYDPPLIVRANVGDSVDESIVVNSASYVERGMGRVEVAPSDPIPPPVEEPGI